MNTFEAQFDSPEHKNNLFSSSFSLGDKDWLSELKAVEAPTLDSPAIPQVDSGFGDWGKNLTSTRTIGSNPGFMDWLFGGKKQDGSEVASGGKSLFGLANSGMKTWLGMKQLDLAEDAFNFQKDSFSKQFGAQQKLTNDQLQWQHKTREDRLGGSGGNLVQI